MITVNIPIEGDEDLKSILSGSTDEQKRELLEILKQEKKKKCKKGNNKINGVKPNPELYGDKEAILKNLKENCVKVEENIEMMGHKGKKVHINLPKIGGDFEGFKFEYFVSYEELRKYTFEKYPGLENKSYSMKDVGGLLKAINRYMKAMGVEMDGDMDYENDLKDWRNKKYNGSGAGDCLKYISGLDNYTWYWLRDKNVDGKKGSYVVLDCYFDDFCSFSLFDDIGYANLFLKLSD